MAEDVTLSDGQLDWLRGTNPCLLAQAVENAEEVTGPRLFEGRMITILRRVYQPVVERLRTVLEAVSYDYLLVDLERTREPGWISLWRPASNGYTFSVDLAGRYGEESARQIVDGAMGQEIAVPSYVIDGMYDHCINRVHTNWLPQIRGHPDSITYEEKRDG